MKKFSKFINVSKLPATFVLIIILPIMILSYFLHITHILNPVTYVPCYQVYSGDNKLDMLIRLFGQIGFIISSLYSLIGGICFIVNSVNGKSDKKKSASDLFISGLIGLIILLFFQIIMSYSGIYTVDLSIPCFAR